MGRQMGGHFREKWLLWGQISQFQVGTIFFQTPALDDFQSNISSVVESLRWWVLNSKIFGQESKYSLVKMLIRFLRGVSVHQKLGILLKNKVVQKLSLEEMFLTKNGLLNCYSKLFF